MAQPFRPAWPARIAKALALLAGIAALSGFETNARVDTRIIKPLPRNFRLVAVEGQIAPNEAQFRRSGNTYVNEAPTATGSNLLASSWFAMHPTDADAVLFEYPATDADGNTIYRLDYALEEDRNRFRLYELNQTRFVDALDSLESAVRRNDASFRERRFYEELTMIWNAHAARAAERPGMQFYVAGLDELNVLIAYSRRLPDGQKIITSTGVLVEAYVR
jgi:hypothetical protein